MGAPCLCLLAVWIPVLSHSTRGDNHLLSASTTLKDNRFHGAMFPRPRGYWAEVAGKCELSTAALQEMRKTWVYTHVRVMTVSSNGSSQCRQDDTALMEENARYDVNCESESYFPCMAFSARAALEHALVQHKTLELPLSACIASFDEFNRSRLEDVRN